VTLETIGDILGQKDKRATEIYRHLLPGYVQAQMEMLGNVATHFSATKTRTGQNLTLVTHDNNKKK
jgi:hypothetical protein